MVGEDPGDDLIEVVVRLPRTTVEQSVRTAHCSDEGDLSRARLALAKAILTSRRRRAILFSGIRFGEPSWDMILDVYVAAGNNQSLKVSKLCVGSGGPSTSALRHLGDLEACGYVSRQVDRSDARSSLIVMQPPLRAAVEAWLDFLTVAQVAAPPLRGSAS